MISKLRVVNFPGLTKDSLKEKPLLISVLHGQLLEAFCLKLEMKQDACNLFLYLALWRN